MKMALVFPRFKYPTGDPPLGMAYLTAAIRDIKGLELDVIDTTFMKKKDVVLDGYDVVAFSCMTTQINDAFELAKRVKKQNPETKIIMGGSHPTTMPNETISNQYVDAIIVGEGELTLAEYVSTGLFEDVDGIWYKRDDRIIINQPREPIENLDMLPFPALGMFPMDKYFQNWFQLESVKRQRLGLNMITSRGCPYQCTFCQPTLCQIFGKKLRKRSPGNIVDEIKHWQAVYGINAVMFSDDTFIIDQEWVHQICDLLIKERVDILWCCNARANLVEYELFRRMKEAGLRKVCLGIESGTQRILDLYNKKQTIQEVREAVGILKSLDLNVLGYFMIGAPTETKEEINQTIKFAKELNIDEATFSITTPLPGTYLYDQTKDHIKNNIEDLDYYNRTIYDTKTSLGQKKLNYLKKKAFLSFYLSRKHISFTIQSFIGLENIKRTMKKMSRF